jgi:general secretion pathway protein G
MTHMRRLRSLRPAPRRAQRGMTLIEIIIVIVLIGGVIAVVGSTIMSNRDRANHRLAGLQVQKVGAAVEQYEGDVGDYPDALDDLVRDPGKGGWLGPYVKDADLKDPFNNALQYRVPGEDGAFDLVSLGKDRQPGGASVDADIPYAP